MEYTFDINNRAFNAIKNNLKRIEIRATKNGNDHFDYSVIKPNDYINFISYDKEKIRSLVKAINWYECTEKLLISEGTRYTLSSTDDYEEGVKSINSIEGYKDAIKCNGVYAIHIEYLN